MIKVYQTIVDREHGNCMQAAIASLFELSLDKVPHFLEYRDKWFETFYAFVREQEYEFDGTLYNYNQWRIINKRLKRPTAKGLRTKLNKIKKMAGVDGYFYASVYSLKYYDVNDNPPITHAVIIDKNLNIVHDVNPNNAGVVSYPESKKLKFNGILNIYMINPKSK